MGQKIFEDNESELKLGFLNINGLMDGNHGDYLNKDKNLLNLDVLVLGETKLDRKFDTTLIEKILDKWDVIGRYDSDDNKKHMGLLLLTPKDLNMRSKMASVSYQCAQRDKDLQIQGIVVKMKSGLSVGFLYCRSTPNNPEIKAINKYFEDCQFLLGDFNLSTKILQDNKKIKQLCGSKKFLVLEETTRVISDNQLDHIFGDIVFKERCFGTSFFNFISDHKAITLRLTLNSELTKDMKEKRYFDSELHLKKKNIPKKQTASDSFKPISPKITEIKINKKSEIKESRKNLPQTEISTQLRRRFRNPDMSTCWLNSCLQLVLSGFDHSPEKNFESELGLLIDELVNRESREGIDPTDIKNIVIFAEDMRIARRKSEVIHEIQDKKQLSKALDNIDQMYLNLKNGQQCVRDFFICLNENMENWMDVYKIFNFTTINLSTCKACGHQSESEQCQIYLEIDVPPNNFNLSEYVEQTLNDGEVVEYHCEDGCKRRYQADKRTVLKSIKETQFIIVMLRRMIISEYGLEIVPNNINSGEDINIR